MLFLSTSLIFCSKSDLSVSYLFIKTNPLVPNFFTFFFFLTTSLFTSLLSLLKSTRTVFNLSMSILSVSAFKLAKSDFDAKLDVSTTAVLLKSVFVA